MHTAVHPPRADLLAMLLGELSAESEQRIALHVHDCPSCLSLVETLEGVEDTFVSALRKSADAELLEISPACAGAIRLAAEFSLPAELAADEASSPPPRISIRDYEILGPIGSGGMGAVYKAKQTHLDKVVAIKLLPPERLHDPAAVARFRREMRAGGNLDHPNLVRALDAREVEGRYFLVMEYIDGLDLSQLVHRVGPLPVSAACELIRQAALGLQHAFEHGLVHRDIKPGNLMLTQQGVVKVLDLGLALLPQHEGHEPTSTGNVMGTLDYMPPEQGGDSHQVDIRADVYSLGATLYKLLTGHAIFHGQQYTTPIQKIKAVSLEPAPAIQSRRSDIPAPLAKIIHRMIAKKPEERFTTPAEVAAALAPFADGSELKSLLGYALDAPFVRPENLSPDGSSARLSSDSTSTFTPSAPTGQPTPAPQTSISPPYDRTNLKWLAAAAGGMAVAMAIWVIVRDKKGNEIARIHSDGPVAVETIDEKEFPPRDTKKPGKQSAFPRPVTPPTAAAPAVLLPPLSRLALVGTPAALPGVTSWTVETVGHRGTIRAVAYSSDGDRVATGGDDGTVRIWNAVTLGLEKLLIGHPYPVQSLAFSPNGQQLVSTGQDETILWETASGRRIRSYRFPQFNCSAVAWGAEPGRFWLGGGEPELRLMDVQRDEPVRFLKTETLTDRMRVSPDQNWIATITRDHAEVIVYGAADGAKHWAHKTKSPSARVAWAPDSCRLALTDSLGAIEVWDMVKREKLTSFRPPLAQPQPTELAWAPQGDLLLLLGQHREIWNAATGTKVRDLGAVGEVAAWSPDGKAVVLGGSDANIYFTGPVESQSDRVIDGHRAHLDLAGEHSWSPDGKHLGIFAVNHAGAWQLLVLDTRTGTAIQSRETYEETGGLSWTADSEQFVVSRFRSELKQAELAFYEDDLKKPVRTVVIPNAGAPKAACFSPDGRWFAVSDNQAGLWVYRATEDKLSWESHGQKGSVLALTWSPDSRELAVSGTEDRQVSVWDVAKGVVARHIPDPPLAAPLRLLRWSPDGKTLAVSDGGGLQFVDAKTGETLIATKTQAFRGFWQPDSDRFVALLYGARCRLLRGATMVGETAGYDVDFAPWDRAGRTLASAEGNAVRIWDLAVGRPAGTLITTHRYHLITIGPTGHTRSTRPLVQQTLRYVISGDTGQEPLTANEFATRFSWQNDEEQATLYTAPGVPQP